MSQLTKSYTIFLSDVDRIQVRQTRSGNRILEFSVQYEALINSRWRKIIRYDNAHDSSPHRHVFYPDNPEYKHPMDILDSNDAFTEAQIVVKKSFMRMKESYILLLSRTDGENHE